MLVIFFYAFSLETSDLILTLIFFWIIEKIDTDFKIKTTGVVAFVVVVIIVVVVTQV